MKPHMNHLRLFYYFLIVIITASLWLTTFIFCLKAKNKSSAYFLIFSFLNIIYFSIIFLEMYIRNSLDFPLTLQQVWQLGSMINRLRFFFFVYFLHALEKNAWSKYADFSASIIMIMGFFILPIFLPPAPRFMMGAVILYALFYTGYLCLSKPINPGNLHVLKRNIFSLSILLTVLMLTDIIEDLPGIELWLAVLVVDLYPLVLAGLSSVYAFYLIRKHFTGIPARNTLKISESILVRFEISAREKEIIALIITGHSNAEIAAKLFIANSTVKKHINKIFKKMNIQTRWQLLKLCQETCS